LILFARNAALAEQPAALSPSGAVPQLPSWVCEASPVVAGSDQSSHAWILIPTENGKSSLILQIPPRTSGPANTANFGTAGAVKGVPRLSVQFATEYSPFPVSAAGWGSGLVIVEDSGPPGFPPQERSVRGVSVVSVEGRWMMQLGADGRPALRTYPRLPVDRPLLGFSAATIRTSQLFHEDQPAAMVAIVGPSRVLAHGVPGVQENGLLVQITDAPAEGWHSLALPDDLGTLILVRPAGATKSLASERRWWLFPTVEGFGLVIASAPGSSESPRAWHGRIELGESPASPPGRMRELLNRSTRRASRETGTLAPTLAEVVAKPRARVSIAWQPIPLSDDVREVISGKGSFVFAVSDAIIAGRLPDEPSVGPASSPSVPCTLWRWPVSSAVQDPAWSKFGDYASIPHNSAVFPIDGGRAIAAVWDASKTPNDASSAQLHMVEISSSTGRVLASGPTISLSLISGADQRFLIASILVIVGTIVIYLLKLTEPVAFSLPAGFSLADPATRILAGLIDITSAALLVGALWGFSFFEMLSISLMRTDDGQKAAATLVGGLIVLNALGECLVGRTFGKALIGIQVVSIIPPLTLPAKPAGPDGPKAEVVRYPSFARSLVRNAVKFLLPPVPILGMLTNDFRHRSDVLARTVVVIEMPEEDEFDGE
jgi:hypothetical protein